MHEASRIEWPAPMRKANDTATGRPGTQGSFELAVTSY